MEHLPSMDRHITWEDWFTNVNLLCHEVYQDCIVMDLTVQLESLTMFWGGMNGNYHPILCR